MLLKVEVTVGVYQLCALTHVGTVSTICYELPGNNDIALT